MARKYGVWSGNPGGYTEDPTRCIATVGDRTMWGPAQAHQCSRKRGHGPDGLYCKQHSPAPLPEQEGRAS